jgi:hypothetical protein
MGNLSTSNTQCCAIQEIGSLCGYKGNPRLAMVDFCRESILRQVKYRGSTGSQDTIYSYYLFSARVDSPNVATYGTQFAKFIEENGLGEVWGSSIRKNEAFHASHWNQVWIWTPDRAKILTWWSKQEESKVKPESVANGRPLHPSGKDICPRCKEGWFRHSGWTCKDGGEWPEKIESKVDEPIIEEEEDELEDEDEPFYDDDDDDLDLEGEE